MIISICSQIWIQTETIVVFSTESCAWFRCVRHINSNENSKNQITGCAVMQYKNIISYDSIGMCCNPEIHDELKNIEVFICPFCDQLLMEGDKATDSCCNEQDIENLNGINTCMNCGSVHSYTTDNEYIDFYANLHKINKKSVYNRFYHIENVLNKMCLN